MGEVNEKWFDLAFEDRLYKGTVDIVVRQFIFASYYLLIFGHCYCRATAFLLKYYVI